MPTVCIITAYRFGWRFSAAVYRLALWILTALALGATAAVFSLARAGRPPYSPEFAAQMIGTGEAVFDEITRIKADTRGLPRAFLPLAAVTWTALDFGAVSAAVKLLHQVL